MTARTEVLSWDWREQPDPARLARALTVVSGGTVHLAQVDVGTDDYVIVLSDEPLTAEQATSAYEAGQ